MTVAITIQRYLEKHDVAYDVIEHEPTESALRSAQAGHIPGDRLAKAVILKDKSDYWVAVLPSTHHIRFKDLSRILERPVGLATEEEAAKLFEDCALGAFPAIGEAYGLKMVVDKSLDGLDDVYIEGGDHESLVHIRGEQFRRLMADAPHGRFSDHL